MPLLQMMLRRCGFALNSVLIRVYWRGLVDGFLFSRFSLTCRPSGALIPRGCRPAPRFLASLRKSGQDAPPTEDVAPLCRVWDMSPGYKHVAPLGLNTSPLLASTLSLGLWFVGHAARL